MPAAAALRGRGLTVSRGPLVVLDSINVTVASGEAIGLVGPNGVGKSTLLGVLAGRIRPDRGSIERTPPAATVGYLPQEPRRDRVELVAAYVERRTGATAATAELDAATMALADREVGAENRYDRALQRWLSLGVADLAARIGAVWSELGLADDLLDQPTASLSGGEAARVGLAALLLSRFDAYLLDEPTNDLDLDGLDRLERWIVGLKTPQRAMARPAPSAGATAGPTARPAPSARATTRPAWPGNAMKAIVLVSHDRTFLARTVDTVVELDEFTHRATTYRGGWQAYLDERAAAERHAWERFDDFETKRTALAGRAQREREWATQGQSKARGSGERDKFIRHHQINQTEQLAGRAARTERAMERLAVVDKPRVPWQLRLDIATASRSGDIVARLSDVVVGGGPFTLGPLDLLITAGERIALIGANGSGKTTLLNTILGRVTPERGTVQGGRSVVTGEIGQARDELLGGGSTDSLLRVFQGLAGLDAGEARTLLAKFGLVADHVLRPPATLSPGERTRASLAVLMAREVNLLVLDEPTNHLDLVAIEQLEVALEAFRGTVLLVTHDRTLLDNVRLTRTIEMAHGQIASDRAITS